MADPRFFDNRGPFTLAEVCKRVDATIPEGADPARLVADVATLEGAGASQMGFCVGTGAKGALAATRAGFCLLPAELAGPKTCPSSTIPLICRSPQHAFAAAAALFYPDFNLGTWNQDVAIHPSARIGNDVSLAPGVVLGPGVEIGDRTRLGPNVVVGRGVAIGRDCEIGSNATIAFSYVGDSVVVLPGAQIGSPGFGFASGARGHEKIPQLGRVIVQDRVEIGACTTIDRGALGDTVIGEGTKIDNLVQVGHNTRIGRHCIIVSQVGISGSCEIGDYVVLGGQVGVADHVQIGDGARLAGRTGVLPGKLEGGRDYGGLPARPVKDWMREVAILTRLVKQSKERNG